MDFLIIRLKITGVRCEMHHIDGLVQDCGNYIANAL